MDQIEIQIVQLQVIERVLARGDDILFGMLVKRGTWRGPLLSWVVGFLTLVLLRYRWETPWPVYTGAELLASLAVFLAEGFVWKQTPAEKAKVDALFEKLRKPSAASSGTPSQPN